MEDELTQVPSTGGNDAVFDVQLSEEDIRVDLSRLIARLDDHVVRGHEKVSTGGQIEVPAGGQVAVPTSR
jgi:hypothetical protein